MDDVLRRIEDAIDAAGEVFERFPRDEIAEMLKLGGDPVTVVDIEIDHVLRLVLQQDGEGWLSEETADDATRLGRDLVWIVDPLDGTREFIDGLPEFCVSIAAVWAGDAVAGGIYNPDAGLRITGAIGMGVTVNGADAAYLPPATLVEMRVLASRTEFDRGTWEVVSESGLDVVPMGSVAYKLARVAAGLDHATWTPVPKHEWDVAGGAALMAAAGGAVVWRDVPLRFNQPRPWFPGALAVPPGFEPHLDLVDSLIDLQTAS